MSSPADAAPPPASGDPYRLLREHTPDRQSNDTTWFAAHHDVSAKRVIGMLADAGFSFEGKTVADIGCGDGAIDLGLVQHGAPASLTGYDLELADRDWLETEARSFGVLDGGLPSTLSFELCGTTDIPAPDASFDLIVSWSTFEHVRQPPAVLTEMRRILKPGGAVFLQIWPLWHSAHGSHLWPWYPEGFANLLHSPEALRETVTANPLGDPAHAAFLMQESTELNRLSIDDLQRSLLVAGLLPVLVQLDSEDVHLPVELAHHAVSDLAISGVALVAVTTDA